MSSYWTLFPSAVVCYWFKPVLPTLTNVQLCLSLIRAHHIACLSPSMVPGTSQVLNNISCWNMLINITHLFQLSIVVLQTIPKLHGVRQSYSVHGFCGSGVWRQHLSGLWCLGTQLRWCEMTEEDPLPRWLLHSPVWYLGCLGWLKVGFSRHCWLGVCLWPL